MSRCDEVEARAAAYFVYMRTLRGWFPPEPIELKRLVLSLQWDPNENLKSFVYTHLLALEKSDNPSRRSRYCEEKQNSILNDLSSSSPIEEK